MNDPERFDALMREAVSAVEAGDEETLARLLAAHPELARDRLEAPGAWLREQVGGALDDFFARPFLLWFVAEDPVRTGRLPANVARLARMIVDVAQREGAPTWREQVDHALRLVSWSWIARECGVQLELIDVLLDAGAQPRGNPENALVNGNVAAAEHLLARGAEPTLASALCLGRWDDVARLAPASSAGERQFALVLAALNGRADAVSRILALGADPNMPSESLYAHGSPLHHAVSSGSLEAVRVLVDAGADVGRRDTAWEGTPLGWAEHYHGEHARDERGARWAAIADYLRGVGARD